MNPKRESKHSLKYLFGSTFTLSIFFFFFTHFLLFKTNNTVHNTVHGTHSHFIIKKILKMGLMVLFTHLKIILLQYFQFSISAKRSCIQTDPKSTWPCIFTIKFYYIVYIYIKTIEWLHYITLYIIHYSQVLYVHYKDL